MLKKFGSVVTNNFGLKVLSIIFAIIMWLVVVNIDDSKITKTFTTTVSITNESAISDMGKYYEVVDGKNTVTFAVSAKRSLIEDLSGSDFKAVADMSLIEDLSRVPIEISALHYTNQISIITRNQYLDVTVGNLQTQSFIIVPRDSGTPASGSVVGSVSVSPNVLKVSGPAEIVSTIDKVTATIDVSNMSMDISDNVIPKLYDSGGAEIDTTNLSMNLSTVTVSAEILNTKEVGLNFQTTGKPADGYQLTSVSYEPETVQVKGAAEDLNKLDMITIPKDVLDISDAEGDITKTVDISSYLPDGVELVDTAAKDISVTVEIEQASTKVFDMPVANITVNNLKSGYEAEFEGNTVKVIIAGFASDLNNLDASKLTGTIDASGLKEGEHTLALKLDLPDQYSASGTQTATFHIVKK